VSVSRFTVRASVSTQTNAKTDGFIIFENWATSVASTAEPASVEKGLFLGGSRATERAVPVREARKPADDIRVDFSMPQTVGIGAAAKKGDTAFLINEVLRVHERQVKELALHNRKFSIDPAADGPVRDSAGLGVGHIGASFAAEQIARELVQQNEKSERAIPPVLPVIQRPTGSSLVGRHKSRADLAVEDVVSLEPFVGTRRSPEGITNMGAANPGAAARKTVEIAKRLGVGRLSVAAVTGDDVLDVCKQHNLPFLEIDGRMNDLGNRIVSANAYLGAEPIAEALAAGADVVITGRVSDPALFLAPLIREFGWAMDDWDRLGRGTLAGHLLECAGQITGGYFADPGYKDVADLGRLGFPIGEVSEDGNLLVTKVPGSGGVVSEATCKEQLLYEVHDPACYVQPDVVADFSHVTIEEVGRDSVCVQGGRGAPRTDTLKVSVGYVDGYVGEGQISYAGPGALERGRLALNVVRERLNLTGVQTRETRFDVIGVDSLHGATLPRGREPYEIRIRVVGRTDSMAEAVRIGNEVETLYTNGPAGGGGAWKSAREVVAVASVLLSRARVKPTVQFLEA
jgi:Acyclic terpene utilisation family protein AtuA